MSGGNGREHRTRSLEQRIGHERWERRRPFVDIPLSVKILSIPLIENPHALSLDAHHESAADVVQKEIVAEDAIATEKEHRYSTYGMYFSPIGNSTEAKYKPFHGEMPLPSGRPFVRALGTPEDPDAYRLVLGKQPVLAVEARLINGRLDQLSILERDDVVITPRDPNTRAARVLLQGTRFGSTGRLIESLMIFAGYAAGRWAIQKRVPVPFQNIDSGRFVASAPSTEFAYAPISCPIQKLSDRYASHQILTQLGKRTALIDAEDMTDVCFLLTAGRGAYKTAQHPLILRADTPYPLRSEYERGIAPHILRRAS